MLRFQSQYAGAYWVVAAYDDWIYGTDRRPDPRGGIACPESEIARTLSSLPPAERPDNTRVSLGIPTMRVAQFHRRPATANDCRRSHTTLWLEIWSALCVDGAATREKMLIGRIPLMVGSLTNERFDAGYFVIEGSERVFVNREARRFDAPRFYKDDDLFCVDVVSENCPLSMTRKGQTLTLKLPYQSGDVEFPLMVALSALGAKDVSIDDLVFEPISQRDAEQKLGKAFQNNMGGTNDARIRAAARNVLDHSMLPFIKTAEEKIEVLMSLARELNRFHDGKRMETDFDAMENKRVDTAGRYIARHACRGIRDMWRKASVKLRTASATSDPQKHIISNQVENVILSAMMSGSDIDDRATTILPRRANWWESVAVCRRVTANVSAESYVVGPRLLHGTWLGFYCDCETQEGEKTGLSRETALFFRTSPIGKPETWRAALQKAPLGFGTARVVVDGSTARRNVDLEQAQTWCDEHKRVCSPFAGVYTETGNVCVDTSEGRAMRPVWRRGKVDHQADFDACVAQGSIVWIDANMVRDMCIATERTRMQPWHTHVELHPMAYLGPSAANIPFLDHNPGSRNLFGSHVRHQAVGESAPFAHWKNGTHDRFDTTEINRLWHTQRAMCDTEIARTLKSHETPCGWNAIVFILADARGQEDAVGISQRHIDLGGAVCETEISFKDQLGTDESFGMSDPSLEKFRKLDSDGFPMIGSVLFEGDVIIAKKRRGRDVSTQIWKRKHGARVRAVSRIGDDAATVRLSFTRWPDIGDKFASRHGQKGVWNFPILHDNSLWTSDGVSPDLVLSPACLPSRMTIGNLFEMLCGKKTALRPPDTWTEHGCGNTDADCSPYSETFDYESIKRALKECGFQPKGHETVYSAKTGRVLDNAQVFIGPAFMQRLTHFSMPKCYARGRGVVNPQTGQPPKGRIHDGGLKLGEMETKAQQAYGAASSLQTTYLECSDGIEVFFCIQCKDVCGFDLEQKCVICRGTERETRKVPRAFMLLRDELKIAKIHMKLIL